RPSMWRRLCLAAVLSTACGSGSSPGSTSTGSFLNGLPSRESLQISVPSRSAPAALTTRSAALVGETASLYVLTRKTSADVNDTVGRALDPLERITRTPPAAVGPDDAAWGPIPDPLSPVAGRLVVHRVSPGAHTFRLDLRPRSADDSAFEPFLIGAST